MVLVNYPTVAVATHGGAEEPDPPGEDAIAPTRSTNQPNRRDPKQIGKMFGLTHKQVNEPIHGAKVDLPYRNQQHNPDVVVDLATGEIYSIVRTRSGTSCGNSLGNIADPNLETQGRD